jgi:hypothetical protein
VYGYSASHYGVYGESANSYGVYGHSSATSGTTYAVYGWQESNAGGAGRFIAANDDGSAVGVYGRSDGESGYGVVGHHFYEGVGVGAWSFSGNLIEAYDGDYPGGVRRFYIDQNGNVYADGGFFIFSSPPSSPDSEARASSAIQSPEVWSEDFGTATLVNGQAVATIDPLFAETVNLKVNYHVFVTALSDEPALIFVSSKEPGSFTVRGVMLDGRPANISFDYRIVAKRQGYETLRMEPAPLEAPLPKKPAEQVEERPPEKGPIVKPQ